MTYNFYIDKKLNNKEQHFIDIKLDYPIILNENQTAKIKVLDVQYLNNIYNVSDFLQNNIITLKKIYKTYDIVNITGIGGDETIIDVVSDLYNPTLTILEKYKETTVLNYDTTNNIFKISNIKYDMEYKTVTLTNNNDPFIIPIGIAVNHYNNIFIDNSNNALNFKPDTHYIIFSNKSAGLDLLKNISYKLKYNGSVGNTSVLLFTLKIEGSNDKLSWNNIPPLVPNSLDIQWEYAETTSIKGVENVNLINSIPYRYYKLSILRNEFIPVENPNLYEAFKLNFIEMKKTSYNLGYTESENIINLTIPNGYYKANNYISTLNTILEPHFIKIELSNITNKLNFISTSIAPSPVYLMTDENYKVYLIFNNLNIRENMGVINENILLPRSSSIEADKNIDLINFKKLILSTNLKFKNKTHNEFIGGNDITTGIGDVLLWIDADEPPLTCVKYKNYELISYDIDDKIINNIIIKLHNEKRQPLYLDNMLLHLEISVS